MKTAIKTIVVLLLIAVVAGLGWMTFGFREWDPEVWKGEFDKIGQSEKTEEQPVVDGDGNELDPDGVNPLPTSMTFSSALNLAGEATSVTVKATVEPSTVQESFKALDWSVAWNNASSEWASGKTVTDYVMVTPTSDGAATATVACKQAFGEQIVLTCASRFFPNAKATATIDYMKKVTGFVIEAEYEPIYGALDQSITLTLDSAQSVFEYQFPDYYSYTDNGILYDNYDGVFPISNVEITYSSEGTISPTLEFEFYYTYNPEMKELLTSTSGGTMIITDHCKVLGRRTYSIDSLYESGDLSPSAIITYMASNIICGYSITGSRGGDERAVGFFAINQLLSRFDTYGELEVVISYGGDKSYSKTFELKPATPLYSSNVTINNDDIVF